MKTYKISFIDGIDSSGNNSILVNISDEIAEELEEIFSALLLDTPHYFDVEGINDEEN